MEPQQAEKPPVPQVTESEVFSVCITKALLASRIQTVSQLHPPSVILNGDCISTVRFRFDRDMDDYVMRHY